MSSDPIVGSYKMETSENFDEFLKAINVGFVMRNLAKLQTPTVTISIDGEEITIKTETTFKTSEMKFKLGEEFTEKRLDGVDVKTKITRDGNKLTQEHLGENPATIIREVEGDKLTTVCKAGDVTSTRVYKRLG